MKRLTCDYLNIEYVGKITRLIYIILKGMLSVNQRARLPIVGWRLLQVLRQKRQGSSIL